MYRLVYLMLLISTTCFAEPGNVIISTMVWSPYADRHMKDNGIIPHIVKEVFSKTKYTVGFEFSDWATLTGNAVTMDEGFSAYMPERYPNLLSTQFNCSDSVLESPMILISRKGHPLTLHSHHDEPHIVGSVSEFPLDKVELDLRVRMKDAIFYDIPNEIKLLRNVIDGNIDFAYLDGLMYYHVLKTNRDIRNKSNNLLVSLIVGTRSMYVCFNKESTKILDAFNKSLVTTDTLKILYEYIPEFDEIVTRHSNY